VLSGGILVILKNYKSLCAKSFDLGSDFRFIKGFLANVLVINILVVLLNFSPKMLKFYYLKVLFLNGIKFI
jgi:hypothetical protein